MFFRVMNNEYVGKIPQHLLIEQLKIFKGPLTAKIETSSAIIQQIQKLLHRNTVKSTKA
jgi:hypothetical protein